jgi:phospholipid transport system substrate-binding protein
LRLLQATFLIFTLSFNVSANDATESHPAHIVVQQTTDKVLSVLKKQQDPQQVNQLISAIVLPQFNFEQMAKWTLGKQWDKLDDNKQAVFVANFRQLLVNTYATALTQFDNQSVTVHKAKSAKNRAIAIVPTTISLTNAKPLQIKYMMMRQDDTWQVVDVSISGVSLIKNYRATYASEIRKGGFDALMEKIIKKNEVAGL